MSVRAKTILTCAILILGFGVMAYMSVRHESPTVDEPICALAGYLHLHDGNFVFDADNPPLWKYWAMLPNLTVRLKPTAASAMRGGGGGGEGFVEATRRLYQTSGNDGDAFVNRSRVMMLLVGMTLAACIAGWAWQLAGATCAVTACTLFVLDPNFLAHAPLVKADVSVALLMFCTAWTSWSIGRRVTLWNVALLGLLCAAAATVKYNTMVVAFIAIFLLLVRTMMREPWPVLGRTISTRSARVGVLLAITATCVLITAAGIWACYGFRYAPSRDPSVTLDIAAEARQLKEERLFVQNGGVVATPEQIDAAPMPLVARGILFLNEYRLFPKSWLFGFISIYRSSTTVARQSYLMDEISLTGWWYYFPLAMTFKTPLATLATAVGAVVVLFVLPARRGDVSSSRVDRFAIACLVVPAVVYLFAAMMSNTNGGIRYALPLYPPIYVGIGIAAAKLRMRHPRTFVGVSSIVALALAVETLATFPFYISFFNVAARPHRFYLLGDSNLDWGQGLKYVADWQREHPDVTLYLGYWGPADPAYYGIRYLSIPGGFELGKDVPPVRLGPKNPPGALMIGATLLQGVNFPPEARTYYAALRQLRPDQIIGDSIWLYRWPPPAWTQGNPPR